MVDPQLIELRADLYHIAGVYNRARASYFATKASQDLPETVNKIVATCHALGWGYTAALNRLLDHLEATVQTEERDAEIERAYRLKELVLRELALITPV